MTLLLLALGTIWGISLIARDAIRYRRSRPKPLPPLDPSDPIMLAAMREADALFPMFPMAPAEPPKPEPQAPRVNGGSTAFNVDGSVAFTTPGGRQIRVYQEVLARDAMIIRCYGLDAYLADRARQWNQGAIQQAAGVHSVADYLRAYHAGLTGQGALSAQEDPNRARAAQQQAQGPVSWQALANQRDRSVS
jgi:hypothetical protein